MKLRLKGVREQSMSAEPIQTQNINKESIQAKKNDSLNKIARQITRKLSNNLKIGNFD